MGKWDKYKKNNENKQNNNGLPAVSINCLKLISIMRCCKTL